MPAAGRVVLLPTTRACAARTDGGGCRCAAAAAASSAAKTTTNGGAGGRQHVGLRQGVKRSLRAACEERAAALLWLLQTSYGARSAPSLQTRHRVARGIHFSGSAAELILAAQRLARARRCVFLDNAVLLSGDCARRGAAGTSSGGAASATYASVRYRHESAAGICLRGRIAWPAFWRGSYRWRLGRRPGEQRGVGRRRGGSRGQRRHRCPAFHLPTRCTAHRHFIGGGRRSERRPRGIRRGQTLVVAGTQ